MSWTFRLGGVRAPLASLEMLFVYVLLPAFLPRKAHTRLDDAQRILDHILHVFPDSVIFLWIRARMQRMQGHLQEAAEVRDGIKTSGSLANVAISSEERQRVG